MSTTKLHRPLLCSHSPPPRPCRRRRALLLLFSSAVLPLPTSLSASSPFPFNPVSESEKNASATLSLRVAEAVRLLDLARDFQAHGDFSRALDSFSLVIKDYKDLAFTEYARVGRALALYEVGDRDEAIAEMEDVSISLKGYPEIHAALAAALYADKHSPLLAENQFAIATLLDPQYTDISYVRETRHWPPSLVRGRVEAGMVLPLADARDFPPHLPLQVVEEQVFGVE